MCSNVYSLPPTSCAEVEILGIGVGCTISQLLTIKDHVLSGTILTLFIYVRDNSAHERFIKEIKRDGCEQIGCYNPTGVITFKPL